VKNDPLPENICLFAKSSRLPLSTTSKKNACGSPGSAVYVTTTRLFAGDDVGLEIFIGKWPAVQKERLGWEERRELNLDAS
jgi:hypothetical protein